MTNFRIAIIGAGPAGCTLAKLLIQANINVALFECETSPDVRSQGGTLDLHTNSGLAALREAGLYEEFLKYARFDGSALKVMDKRLKAYFSLPGEKEGSSSGRPEIDRKMLRKLLYESLPLDTIRWGYRLMRVSDDLTLNFEQGDMSGFDLVVGADGAWSKVRPLLTDVQPQHALVSGFHFKISDPENRCPDLYKLVNRGSVFSFSDGHSLALQQMGDGSLSCGEWATRDETWDKVQGFDINDSKAVKAFLLEEYHDWSPKLRQFIEMADDMSFVYRPLYMLPVGHSWENRPGVTLVGDAAHLTVPFAGEGVNLAMRDSMSLAHAIIEAEKQHSKAALITEVKSFEDGMFKRAKEVQQRSIDNMQDMFLTEGAPRTVIERYVTRSIQSQTGPILGSLVVIPVYLFYWVYKLVY
jgi:2-polyprenyl-6-methoxyphenol hydroxylase-like FAD-dependent oxidoreductase